MYQLNEEKEKTRIMLLCVYLLLVLCSQLMYSIDLFSILIHALVLFCL